MTRLAFILGLLGLSTMALADSFLVGTWLPRNSTSTLVMLVEEVGAGRKITYKAILPDGKFNDKMVMTMQTQLDGNDAPVLVNGKPTGETMAVRRIDANHMSTVLKMQGKQFGTSRAEVSPDGKVLKVDNEITDPIGGPVGKRIEYWDRK